jgi:diguanylate cyclase (GGDEF)-like protein
MGYVLKFIAVLAAFVIAVSTVVWTTAGAERAAAGRTSREMQAADGMMVALIARESAFRGYAQSERMSMLEPYDEAAADLAGAADRARAHARGDQAELREIGEQERLAERWAASANDSIIRIRNGRVLGQESELIRSNLKARFTSHNDALRRLILSDNESAHRSAVERAVFLVALLTASFAAVGGLLGRRVRRREAARREAEEAYHRSQREFAETLQITESEVEAHAVVKRHLERSLDGANVIVLNRNNSQNRLEATTPIDEESTFARNLTDATPAACLSVRLGRPHARATDNQPLLACGLCGDLGRSTCVPSLVGGEVIGSVLVEHADELEPAAHSRIVESVSQAAPVLANLRNLAVAEIRAATDGLTGLPNARALRDNLKRMVAHATRSEKPLAAILCDLDHFKQINDVHGHDKGDEALAAAATVLQSGLRESDIAGRYGGEEFLLLLPDTSLAGAVVAAEKLREELTRVTIPGLPQVVTASFGVACFPNDAYDPDALVRVADRALYAAKARGRNCVVSSAELFADEPLVAAPSS